MSIAAFRFAYDFTEVLADHIIGHRFFFVISISACSANFPHIQLKLIRLLAKMISNAKCE